MRLLNIMERHIRDGLHLQLQCSAEQVRIFFDFKCCELETFFELDTFVNLWRLQIQLFWGWFPLPWLPWIHPSYT